jgi:hypothetical protein
MERRLFLKSLLGGLTALAVGTALTTDAEAAPMLVTPEPQTPQEPQTALTSDAEVAQTKAQTAYHRRYRRRYRPVYYRRRRVYRPVVVRRRVYRRPRRVYFYY